MGFRAMTVEQLERPLGVFAQRIAENKNYCKKKDTGRRESWDDVTDRVVYNIVRPYMPELVEPLRKIISRRMFIPGGRYLYASGLRTQQINNCLGGETKIVTKSGVFRLREIVGKTIEVLNKSGQWEQATVHSFGVQKLWRVNFSNGDFVRATAGHRWWMEDGTRLTTSEIDHVPLLMPSLKINLDEEGIRHGICYGDGTIQRQIKTDRLVLCSEKKRCLVGYFPQGGRELSAGLTVTKLPRRYKTLPDPRNCTPEYARGFIAGLIATDGCTRSASVTISCNGWKNAKTIIELATLGGCVVCGIKKESKPSNFGERNAINCIIMLKRFSVPLIRPDQIQDCAAKKRYVRKMYLTVDSVTEDTTEEVFCCTVPGSESFTLANGLITSNCVLMRASDTKEGWGKLANDAFRCLMTGNGIGVVYSDIREKGAIIHGMGGNCTGPIALMNAMNDCGRQIMQGGSRRSAIWAGLHWNHPDVFDFITCKNWNENVRYCKARDFNFPAPMDGTNISVILDDAFFLAYNDSTSPQYNLAQNVYWSCVKHMLKTGEPGFSVDIGENAGKNNRNACTEVDSADNLDMCNLGSLNMARIDTKEDFYECCKLGIAFLLCGTMASYLPVNEMYIIREKNRRLGLGLMGLHAWLLRREKKYGKDDELGEWLDIYKKSGDFAKEYTDKLSISTPVATRSVAPNGTISIIGETTGGIEPIFAVAYKRRFLEGQTWKAQYIPDPTAKLLVEDYGVDPNSIEDSFTLADDIQRRLEFQAWVQAHVDHGISSTLNLPEWGSSTNNKDTIKQYGNTFMQHLPHLRGMTTYPNGARDGQPLTRMSYYEAMSRGFNKEFDDGGEGVNQSEVETLVDEHNLPIGATCKSGVCGE